MPQLVAPVIIAERIVSSGALVPHDDVVLLRHMAAHELRAPGVFGLNVSLFKAFPLRDRLRLQVRMDAQGITNTPNFAAPGTNLSSIATFGVITSAGGSRQLQGSARITF